METRERDQVEVKPTWKLAWGLFWRISLISLGVYGIIWLIVIAVIGISFLAW